MDMGYQYKYQYESDNVCTRQKRESRRHELEGGEEQGTIPLQTDKHRNLQCNHTIRFVCCKDAQQPLSKAKQQRSALPISRVHMLCALCCAVRACEIDVYVPCRIQKQIGHKRETLTTVCQACKWLKTETNVGDRLRHVLSKNVRL